MFDRKVGYYQLMKKLKQKWSLKGSLSLIDIGYDYYVAKFTNMDDYNYVLTQGPWMINDGYLTVRKWVHDFVPDDSPLRFLTAWIRIPFLSVEYLDANFLKRLRDKIGKIVRVDHTTATVERAQFTRISVEVDLTKPLLSMFRLHNRIWHIQKNDKGQLEKNGVNGLGDNKEAASSHPYGSWMHVKKPARKRISKDTSKILDNSKVAHGSEENNVKVRNPQKRQSNTGGSRFNVLSSMGGEDDEAHHDGTTIVKDLTGNVNHDDELEKNQMDTTEVPNPKDGNDIVGEQQNHITDDDLFDWSTQAPTKEANRPGEGMERVDMLKKFSIGNNAAIDSMNGPSYVNKIAKTRKSQPNNKPHQSQQNRMPTTTHAESHVSKTTPNENQNHNIFPSHVFPPTKIFQHNQQVNDTPPPSHNVEHHPTVENYENDVPGDAQDCRPQQDLEIDDQPFNDGVEATLSLKKPFVINLIILTHIGVGSSKFLITLKEIIRMNHPNVVTLVETHLDGDRAECLGRQIQYDGHARVDAEGYSAGIWLYWKKSEVNVDIIAYYSQHLTVKISRDGEESWIFSAIYASPDINKRQELWNNLSTFSESLKMPWLLVGDFNETTTLDERHDGTQDMQRRCDKFKNWIENTSLIDLGYSGAKFTWTRGKTVETRKAARLDRGLCNLTWRTRFPEAAVKHLPAINSDHSPLFIKTNGLVPPPRGHKPFRFLSAWLTHENFETFVKTTWRNDIPIVLFLKKFAEDQQEWNKTKFGNIFRKKRHLWARIAGVQKALVERKDKYLLKLETRLRLCDSIDKKTRKFIWGGTDEEKKIHLLSWNTLQKDRKKGGLGIRSMRQANAAFLTKLGWRMLAEPNSLWSQVLRSKYCKGRCDLDMFSSKKNSSNVWQGIVENANFVRRGTRVSVGNGRRTLFWDHCWATETPLSSMAISPIPVEAQDRTVDEYWNSNGLENDSMYWGGSTIGKFSVKSAISLIRNDGDVKLDRKWVLVWKAPVSERIRMFIWLALHDRLLSNVQRVARRLSDDPRCTRCGADEESLDHILRRCPFSFIIWNKLARDKLKQSMDKERKEILISWVAPPVSWVLLNTDGASRGNPGEAGGGGIMRDAQGYFIRAFTENYGICTVTRSEILALLRGILMARDAGIKKLIIKVDSQVVVQLMEGETSCYSPAVLIVHKCRELLRRSDWEVKLEHCYREANRAADWLANHGCEQQERVCMFDSPLLTLCRSSLMMLKVLLGLVM
ncbi:hypothetical protein CTI12_AA523610 [Artemisia annua]|uniref:RNase H type-1 domain-containing protein n=1 Tax=Artemisia annua TaxID=35608 RepID=A0A2U1L6A7_ARTAN|nr:hypothetical protein CTI12_AA523610 [Artemisia annua]